MSRSPLWFRRPSSRWPSNWRRAKDARALAPNWRRRHCPRCSSDLLEQAALLAEDEQDAFVEWQVGMIKKLNLRPIITGAGQGSSADETTVTEAFGTKVLGIRGAFVKPGESVWEYRDRIRGQTA